MEFQKNQGFNELLDKYKLNNIDVSNRLKQIQDIINILTKIVKTTQERLK